MKYKNIIIFFLITLILTSLIGCGLRENDIGQEENLENDTDNLEDIIPKVGGSVSIPLTNFSTLNPLLTDNSSYYHFSKLIFEGLFDFDENLKPRPKLAESYKISQDGKTVSIKIKEGIQWHDGQALTSEDIEFTIDAIKKSTLDSTYGRVFRESLGLEDNLNLSTFINSEIIDSRNIEIIFDREFANVLGVLTFPIIAKHAFPHIEAALSIEDYKPLGTGPFKFEDYEKFKSVNLKGNWEYWDGPIYIENIMGRVLDDNGLILTSFETGQIDFAFSMGVDWDKYRQNKRIKVYEYISSDYEFLGFNFAGDKFTEEEGIALRKAINYGIDRQNIIENQYLGHGTQIDVPIHPKSYLLDDISEIYGFNLNFAREELLKAGFIDNDEDGILESSQGIPLNLRLLTNTSNLSRLRTGEIIIEDLRKLGIEVSLVENISNMKLLSQEDKDIQWDLVEDNLAKGNFDIALLGWKTSVIPNISYMFHSSNIKDTNFIKYENELMDRLLENSLNSGLGNKQENYKALQEHILDQLPYVSLFYKNQALLVDSGIKGDLSPNFYNLYNGLDKCFVLYEKN